MTFFTNLELPDVCQVLGSFYTVAREGAAQLFSAREILLEAPFCLFWGIY